MDTSARTDLSFLMGWEKRPAESISAEAWLQVIYRTYASSAPNAADLTEVPELCERVGDILSNQHYTPRPVPRGLTAFDEGLGVNTTVCVCNTHSSYSGKQFFSNSPQLWTHTAEEFLLLLPGKGRALIQWAIWGLEYQRAIAQPPETEHRFITTITRSSVSWLARWDGEHIEEKPVVDVFRRHPHVPLVLLDKLQLDCTRHARRLREVAENLDSKSERAQEILGRVQH